MLGPFIDTIVVCTLTAMVLLITGVWSQTGGLEGSELTAKAFSTVYGIWGEYVVVLAVILFAFSTIISWSYYGEQGITFIFGDRGVKYYRVVFTGLVLYGSMSKLSLVLNFSDAFVGLMVVPNLIACLALIFTLRKKMNKYRADYKARRI
jgi:AGCS family alanine or glycine:cation symporter